MAIIISLKFNEGYMRLFQAGLFFIMLVCVVYITGCTQSPPTKAVTPSFPVTTIITTAMVTTVPTPPPQTPTIPPACADLAATITDDSKFLTSLNDFNIVGQIRDFASDGCDRNASLQIDQLLKKIPKPRDPTLARARTYLIDAASYCQSPTSASPGRVADELDTFTATYKEFQESETLCRNTIPAIVAQSESGSQKTNFYGTGSDQEQFTLNRNTIWKFAMTYSGEDKFIVEVKDSQFNVVDKLADQTGSYMGKKSVSLRPGTYYLRVTATGPWAVILTSQ
jgi:hypothetical protein